jgi:hypothetical protein
VRYRYDEKRLRRYKTVALIEDETVWAPDMSEVVAVRVEGYEVDLRAEVKGAGGRWDHKRKVWQMTTEQVLALGLEDRIVTEQESI